MSLFGDYERTSNSIAQDQLEASESLLRGKAAAIRSDAAEQGNLLQGKFSDVMATNQSDFIKDVAIEQSVPGVLSLARAGATRLGGAVGRIVGAAGRAEDMAGGLAEKLAPNAGEAASDTMEMKDMSSGAEQGAEQGAEELGEEAGKEASSALGGVAETNIDSGITELGAEAGEEAADLTEETLPELASGLGSTIGEALGTAIPVVGWIGSLAGLITGAVDLSKTPDDPFQAISQKIQSANTQTQAIESKVSSDEFQQRIGASMPSFGSLAAAGQRVQQGVALHD